MEENEEFDSDFTEDIPISEEFWNYMEDYWHNNREFPESTEVSLSKKADLINGKVPASQLPSYVDDVLEFDSFEKLPNPGEKGKIYLITNNNNTQFRWSGSEYIQLNSDENVVTTNTEQRINGKKSFVTAGGNGYNNHSLRAFSTDGSNPGLTFYKDGLDSAVMYFDAIGNFKFRNAYDTLSKYVFAQGYKKDGSDDNSFLTAGGGSVLRSSYPTTTQADSKYIPYFGATANINLNAKPIANAGTIDATVYRNMSSSTLVKTYNVHDTTNVTSYGIKLTYTGTSKMMGSFTVTLFGYTGSTISFRVTMYKYNHNWYTPTITWLHGNSSKISNVEFYKEDDSNLHLKVNFATNFGSYHKSVITDVLAFQGDPLHNPDTYTLNINPDNCNHTLVTTIINDNFVRDVGQNPKNSISLSTSDLNTITSAGFYNQTSDTNATSLRNYPVNLAGSLNVFKTIGNGVTQEYTTYNLGITYKRIYNATSWSNWRKVLTDKEGTASQFLKADGSVDSMVALKWNNNLATPLNQQENVFNWYNGAITGANNVTSWTGNFLSFGGNSILHKSQFLVSKTKMLFRTCHGNSDDGAWNEVYHTGNFNPTNYASATHVHSFSSITSKPTTLSGYGITDAISVNHPVGGINATQINDWNTAFAWGNHATAGYAGNDFVNESIEQITAEYIDPNYHVRAESKINTIIITEEFKSEYLELASDLIPERQITVINLSSFEINVTKDGNQIDMIKSKETTEYYITSEKRLIKKRFL